MEARSLMNKERMVERCGGRGVVHTGERDVGDWGKC